MVNKPDYDEQGKEEARKRLGFIASMVAMAFAVLVVLWQLKVFDPVFTFYEDWTLLKAEVKLLDKRVEELEKFFPRQPATKGD